MLNQVIQGDALASLQSLPSEMFEVGVTSPPYNKQENKKGWLVKSVTYFGASDKKEEQAYQQEQIEMLNGVYRVMKAGASFFYNHKLRWEKGDLLHPMQWLCKTHWVIRQELIWDRVIAANIRGWRFWQVEERIYWLYKPLRKHKIGQELRSKHALMSSIWRFGPEEKNPHPAPFPLTLPTRAIYSILDDHQNGAVLDPYCGSGTTLVAAKLLGHHYLGIDISPSYVSGAKRRLHHCAEEKAVVETEMAKHQVRTSFKEKKARGAHVGRFRPLTKHRKDKYQDKQVTIL